MKGARGKIADFWQLIERDPLTACWYWRGRLDTSAKPVMYFGGRVHSARRIGWTLVHGQTLSPAVVVLGQCLSALCVNPAHAIVRPKGTAQSPRARRNLSQTLRAQRASLLELLQAGIAVCGQCLIWKGKLRGRIPVIYRHDRIYSVRRLLWEHQFGALTAQQALRSVCPQDLCVAPRHALPYERASRRRARGPALIESRLLLSQELIEQLAEVILDCSAHEVLIANQLALIA